jgi:hypothetical protein
MDPAVGERLRNRALFASPGETAVEPMAGGPFPFPVQFPQNLVLVQDGVVGGMDADPVPHAGDDRLGPRPRRLGPFERRAKIHLRLLLVRDVEAKPVDAEEPAVLVVDHLTPVVDPPALPVLADDPVLHPEDRLPSADTEQDRLPHRPEIVGVDQISPCHRLAEDLRGGVPREPLHLGSDERKRPVGHPPVHHPRDVVEKGEEEPLLLEAVAIVLHRKVPARTRRRGTLPLRRKIPLLRQCGPSGCNYQLLFRQEGGETSHRIRRRD